MDGFDLILGLVVLAAIATLLVWALLVSGRPVRHRDAHSADPMPSFLVAVDDSKQSARAVDLACSLAAERHAKLILTSVIPVPMRFALDAPLPQQDYRARLVLESAVLRASGKQVKCESRIVKDRTVAAGLIELARSTHASMVILGLDGSIQKGLSDLLVVSDLFRHTPCEVLVAHEPIEGEAASARIGRLIEPAFRG